MDRTHQEQVTHKYLDVSRDKVDLSFKNIIFQLQPPRANLILNPIPLQAQAQLSIPPLSCKMSTV